MEYHREQFYISRTLFRSELCVSANGYSCFMRKIPSHYYHPLLLSPSYTNIYNNDICLHFFNDNVSHALRISLWDSFTGWVSDEIFALILVVIIAESKLLHGMLSRVAKSMIFRYFTGFYGILQNFETFFQHEKVSNVPLSHTIGTIGIFLI